MLRAWSKRVGDAVRVARVSVRVACARQNTACRLELPLCCFGACSLDDMHYIEIVQPVS